MARRSVSDAGAAAVGLPERDDALVLGKRDARVLADARGQRLGDRLARLRAVRVGDAAHGVTALAAEAVVELDAGFEQIGDPRGRLLGQYADRALAAESPAGAKRVLRVQLRAVVVGERRGHAALRVPAVRGRDRRLGEQEHVRLGGGGQRRAQPRDPSTDDQHINCHEVFSSKSITCARVYMVSDPKAKTSTPFHAVLAVVLQVRDGRLQVLLWERALDPFRGSWSLPGGTLAEGETLEQSIRRHLATKVDVRDLSHIEQLETLSQPGRHPRALGAGHGLPRPRPERRRSRDPRRHELVPRRRAAAARVRPRPDRARRPRAAAGEALVHERRVRARARRVHDLRAARPLPRRARARRVGDEPPAGSAAAAPARADRQPQRARPGRRAPGGAVRLREPRAGDHRSVRGPATARFAVSGA